MQSIRKIILLVLIVNIIFYLTIGIIYFLGPGMSPILGVFFSILVVFNLIILVGLFRLKIDKNSKKTPLIIIGLLTVGFTIFTIFCFSGLRVAINTTRYYQENKSKLTRFLAGKAPIENGVWEYERWDDNTSFTVPCKDGKIHGRAITEEKSGFVTNEFYKHGDLDSIIVYTEFAIFSKEYFDEKVKTTIQYEYSNNYEELIDIDTVITILNK